MCEVWLVRVATLILSLIPISFELVQFELVSICCAIYYLSKNEGRMFTRISKFILIALLLLGQASLVAHELDLEIGRAHV